MVPLIDSQVYHKVVSFSCVGSITIHYCQSETYVKDGNDLQRSSGMLPFVVNDWTPLFEYVAVEI